MFDRHPTGGPEDPSVARIEELLGAPTLLAPGAPRPITTSALWICACVAFDDAPTWLIWDAGDHVAWCRVPDEVEPLDLVDAELTAGGHADPAEVLRWLEGSAADPWSGSGDGTGAPAAVAVLGRRIRAS